MFNYGNIFSIENRIISDKISGETKMVEIDESRFGKVKTYISVNYYFALLNKQNLVLQFHLLPFRQKRRKYFYLK